MDQKIYQLLMELNDKVDGMQKTMDLGFNKVNERLEKIEDKLDGIANQFEQATSQRIEDTEEIIVLKHQMARLEKEFILSKHRS